MRAEDVGDGDFVPEVVGEGVRLIEDVAVRERLREAVGTGDAVCEAPSG